ncbi:MAG TPA: prepilin-type N-terminal cleavage/methylation domain-containing protein, partial [Steroidobacteraceae bacterium]|nr:prepilin-type N-terminal cleavage/methylation domain-containing protein [Steroidobacteraceae bacterium]
MNTRSSRGFTLLELLIAIVIFAIVGVLAMGGYNQLVRQREIAAATMERVRNLQRTVMRMSQDFEQLAARPIRDATSATDMPALLTSTNTGDLVEFTRAG